MFQTYKPFELTVVDDRGPLDTLFERMEVDIRLFYPFPDVLENYSNA